MARAAAFVWVYDVKPEHLAAFRDAYGGSGVWAKFFARSPGYLRTDLFEDAETPGRFMTVDYFRDAQARRALVEARADAYKAIDAEWAKATRAETFVGQFDVDWTV